MVSYTVQVECETKQKEVSNKKATGAGFALGVAVCVTVFLASCLPPGARKAPRENPPPGGAWTQNAGGLQGSTGRQGKNSGLV